MANARTITIELSTDTRDLVADLGLDSTAFLDDVAARAAEKMNGDVEVRFGRIDQNVIEINGHRHAQGYHVRSEEAEILSQIVTDALGV